MSGAGAPPAARDGSAELVRGLGARDGALLTVGAVLGSGVFLAAGDVARAVPHAGMVLVVWLAGGLLALAGAVTYAELGALFPRAGGLYHFLREAYGPLWGFLYGWASFVAVMSGGLAAIAAGFGEYLGSFVPAFSGERVVAAIPLAGWTWRVTGAQLGAALALVSLTAVNHVGLAAGAAVQGVLTALKVAAVAALALAGLLAPARVEPDPLAPLPASGLLAGFAVAMIAAVWTYDGWYALTFSAGELRDAPRSLPRAMVAGTAVVTALYVALNLVYLRALSLRELAASPRPGEAAAEALLGPAAGRLLAALVLVSTFGCLASTILYSSRIYLPMARDGLFFAPLAAVHARFRTPVRSLWAQSAWATALVLSATYGQLYTYTTFVVVLFHAAAGLALFVLRRARPRAERPYRAWGYPVVPAAFVLASLALLANTLVERPIESAAGLVLVAGGLPAYAFWQARGAGRLRATAGPG